LGFLVWRMIPEKMFQQILTLGEAWRVMGMDYQEKEQRVLIRVEETPALWPQESCPQGLTTAFLEGLNSLFSATKRKARGYRPTEYQTATLYFVAGKLEIPYYG
jgi:hypothetical protein